MNRYHDQKRNHEYTPPELMRFHLHNIVTRVDQLAAIAENTTGQEHLASPARQVLRNLSRHTSGVPKTFVNSEMYYRSCANALTAARSITDGETPSQRKTLTLQALNSAIYSTIAIIKLMTLHPNKPTSTPAKTNQPPPT